VGTRAIASAADTQPAVLAARTSPGGRAGADGAAPDHRVLPERPAAMWILYLADQQESAVSRRLLRRHGDPPRPGRSSAVILRRPARARIRHSASRRHKSRCCVRSGPATWLLQPLRRDWPAKGHPRHVTSLPDSRWARNRPPEWTHNPTCNGRYPRTRRGPPARSPGPPRGRFPPQECRRVPQTARGINSCELRVLSSLCTSSGCRDRRTLMPPTACAVIDSERRLTPTRALPLRCRLALAKMRSDHPPCIGSRMVYGVSFDDHLDRDDLVVRLPQFHPLVIASARR
jgi:hypothetical protein